MAHHQRKDYDRTHSVLTMTSPHNLGGKLMADGEELGADNDEPPDSQIKFSKMTGAASHKFGSDPDQHMSPRCRKASLLTQAFASPELGPLSDVEAPVLTSDGGMTSPARTSTPSPPLPTFQHMSIDPIEPKVLSLKHEQQAVRTSQDIGLDRTQEVKVEEELGRRRCISFACFQKNTSKAAGDKTPQKVTEQNPVTPATATPQKRPCMLRFACPTKPTHTRSQEHTEAQTTQKPNPQRISGPRAIEASSTSNNSPQNTPLIDRIDHETSLEQNPNDDSKATAPSVLLRSVSHQDRIPHFNRIDFQKSEATRFHEFAGSFADEGEWVNEQTAFRQKITINDTLRKENAIRKLAEEAEEEAREEDDDPYENELDSPDEASDDGNESDDEEGFADSDDESDDGSAYQFWTPGLTTAATSTDQLEHHRPVSHRTISESSVESVIGAHFPRELASHAADEKVKKGSRVRKGTRPNPSDLPDSSDFVVGTIDEDQLFEEKYLSRVKEKERLKQKLIPQDIDPSFPTSDPEAEADDDDDDEPEDEDEGEGEEVQAAEHDVPSRLDSLRSNEFDSAEERPSRAKKIVPNPSPRRLHSPPPSRRLFGQANHHFRSPPPLHRKLISPPSSRRPSPSGSPYKNNGINIARLAQRPNLTHTASLPRTPNPFWHLHGTPERRELSTSSTGTSPKSSYPVPYDDHRRGPIEIVQGLENRRQRRKEKLWRQHCSRAHAGKERERRCQPGRGAQRMREVGLVMADRFKGYKQDTKLVLSV